jgi:YVTN family beta-propeller protein
MERSEGGRLVELLLLILVVFGSTNSWSGERVHWQAQGPVRWQAETLIAADFDRDGLIGFADFILFVSTYNSRTGDATFNSRMDLNSDGSIDFSDFVTFSGVYGSKAALQPPDADFAVYVVNPVGGEVPVFDTDSHLIYDVLPFRGPTGLRISKDERLIYVSEGFGFFVLDAQHEVVYSVPTNSQGRIALSPDERVAYVTQENLDVLLVIDVEARATIDTIQVGRVPVDIAITPDGKKLYVVNAFGRDITVIDADAGQVTGTIDIGATPGEIVVTKDGLRAYVSNLDRGVLSVLDLVRDLVVGAIKLPVEASRGLALSPDGETLYVGAGGLLVAVSVTRNLISRSLRVGNATAALGILPDGTRAYVGSVDVQRGGAGMTVVDLVNWQVMGRMLGVSFAAQVGFRRLGPDQVVAQ